MALFWNSPIIISGETVGIIFVHGPRELQKTKNKQNQTSPNGEPLPWPLIWLIDRMPDRRTNRLVGKIPVHRVDEMADRPASNWPTLDIFNAQIMEKDVVSQSLRRLESNWVSDVQDMMNDVEPPFAAEILTEEFSKDFKMPTLKEYDGEGNLVSHLTTFQSRMTIRRASPSIKCKAFPLTLIQIDYDWFYNLKPKFILSYEQLNDEFLARFPTTRLCKRDITYLTWISSQETRFSSRMDRSQ